MFVNLIKPHVSHREMVNLNVYFSNLPERNSIQIDQQCDVIIEYSKMDDDRVSVAKPVSKYVLMEEKIPAFSQISNLMCRKKSLERRPDCLHLGEFSMIGEPDEFEYCEL